MSTFNFTIGADPEIFVRKGEQLVTAHGLIPGNKHNPHKITDGAIQVDGMALEFNIDATPIEDFELFNRRMVNVMATMKKALPRGHNFVVKPSVQFDEEYYALNVPEEAKELGCEPDFCAYSEDIFEPNPRPDGDSGLRSAAGHIHVGWDPSASIPVDNAEHVEICRSLVRNLDVYVGLAMTIIDGDTERRKLYGQAGAFRPKPYGVEYRTPSNAWISSKTARRFIHSMVSRTLANMRASYGPTHTRLEGVRSIINRGDADDARRMLTSIGVYVPAAVVKMGPLAAKKDSE